MSVRQKIRRIMPGFLKRGLGIYRDKQELQQAPSIKCDAKNLRSVKDFERGELFSSHETETKWSDVKKKIDVFDFPDGTGGVNTGDRRAIFYIISRSKPSSVLEVGTHIGASTLHIASALHLNQKFKDTNSKSLISVDIVDVNDSVSKPWLKYNAKQSPIDIINKMNFQDHVEFITSTSLDYFSKCDRKFDFIFLDGGHEATTVYQEVPAALKLLNEGGVILLHDYFPNLKPLWSDGVVIPGPFLAIERLKDEGAKLNVIPLGELPWQTKFQSNITSLALLCRTE